MKKYQITYKECGETHTWYCKAYDADHAEEKFCDPEQGFSLDMIVSVKRYFTEAERIAKKYKRDSIKL